MGSGERRGCTAAGTSDQHGDFEVVTNAIDSLAEEEIADQTVAVRADYQQVHGVNSQVADKLPAGSGP